MKQYYYIGPQNQQMGPYSYEELKDCVIGPNTKIWYQGLPNWVQACEISELQGWFPPSSATTVPPYQPFQPQQPSQPTPPQHQQSYQSVNPVNPGVAKPDSWLIWSILSTVLCCLPCGVVAIIYASKVDKLWMEGNYAEAQKSAEQAKLFTLISAGLGVVGGIIGFIMGLAGAFA